MQDIPTKVTGSTLTASEFNNIPDELENGITTADIALSGSDLEQLAKAMAVYAAGSDFYTDSGAADAYVLTAIGSRKSPPAYFDGMQVRFRATNANTGASTVNVATIGVKNIKLPDGSTDPGAGDIDTSGDVIMRYDGTNFLIVLTSIQTSGGVSATAQRGYIDGLIMSNDGGDTDHDIATSIGVARDNADTQTMTAAAFTKRIDANWVAGSGNGGFPSGLSLSIDTWYHYYIIEKIDGTADFGFDTSLTASNLLADATGYSKFRRIGSVLTDGSSNILQFYQWRDMFLWDTVTLDIDTTFGATRSNATILTPLGLEVISIVNILSQTNDTPLYITYPGVSDATPTATILTAPLATVFHSVGVADYTGQGNVRTLTNTSSQIGVTASAASKTVKMSTIGWVDSRGRDT